MKDFSRLTRAELIDLARRLGQKAAANEVQKNKHTDALRQSEQRLRAIVDSSDDAIIGKTLDGTITSWNNGAKKIFGYSAREAVGKSMLLIILPERRAEEPQILARIARGESVDHFETVRVRKDGKKIHVSATISAIRNAAGKIIGASKIARDITVRRSDLGVFGKSGDHLCGIRKQRWFPSSS